MSERWFTDRQVLQVARDLQEADGTIADAMDMPSKAWGDLSEERQRFWIDRATADLAKIVPLDLSRPLRLRDGTAVADVRSSEDGLLIVARVDAWETHATWPRDGMLEKEHPSDLIYDRVFRAREFAREKHAAQLRRYTDEPYFVHLQEVAGMVERAGLGENATAAAWLHDVCEDQGVPITTIMKEFNLDVARMVADLTDEPAGRGVNRATRKAIDADRLSRVLADTQSIKCADMISNTASVVKHDPGFAVQYLKELRAVLDILTRAHPGLKHAAEDSLRNAEQELLQAALSTPEER